MDIRTQLFLCASERKQLYLQSRPQSPRTFKASGGHTSTSSQSRTQSPQAFWSAGRRQERLWDNGISYPRKRGIPVFVRMLKIKAEVKCPKMAAALPEGFIGP